MNTRKVLQVAAMAEVAIVDLGRGTMEEVPFLLRNGTNSGTVREGMSNSNAYRPEIQQIDGFTQGF